MVLSSYKSLTEKSKRKSQAVITAYRKASDWPKWFKGLSIFQVNGIDSLHNNLRDDLDQETFGRVRITLIILGIDPIVKPKELRKVMLLSRGNDIAFLWFLWQLHYLSPAAAHTDLTKIRYKYSDNEKILLTSICSLDTITTLRALDKMLPKQKPKPVVKIAEKRKMPPRDVFPYFETLTKPILHVKKPLKLKNPPANLENYAKYLNPRYSVPNESNRWFVDFKLNHTKRICLNILTNTVNELNVEDDGGSDPKKKCPKNLLDDVIDSLPCCEKHKQMRADEQSRENKLYVQRIKGCLKNLNPGENRKEAMRRKVLKNIERDVNAFKEKSLKELTKEHKIRQKKLRYCKAPFNFVKKKVSCDGSFDEEEFIPCKDMDLSSEDLDISSASSGANSETKCNIPLSRLVFNEDDDKKLVYFQVIDDQTENESSNLNCQEKDIEMVEDKDNGKENENKDIGEEKEEEKRNEKENGKQNEIKGMKKEEEKEKENVKFMEMEFGETNKKDLRCHFEDDISKYDYQHYSVCKPEHSFFEAPGYNKPYKFIYENIFDSDKKEKIKNPFKTGVAKALGIDAILEDDEALFEYCKNVWNHEVAEWNKKHAETDKLFKTKKRKVKVYRYTRDYYDPRDEKLMNVMLFEAIDELRKNKKYVLASLPEAHKIPILRAWIRNRYGMVYTEKEKHTELEESVRVFRALGSLALKVPPVPFSQFIELSYKCRNHMYNKSVEERRKYEYNFRAAVLDPISTFWTATCPYSCSGGPPRSTFFAYLPANGYHIAVFNPWQPFEYNAIKKRKLTK